MENQIELYYTSKTPASFFVFAYSDAASFSLNTNHGGAMPRALLSRMGSGTVKMQELVQEQVQAQAREIEFNGCIQLNSAGIYCVWILPAASDEALCFSVQSNEAACPFLIPGPGIVPSHFPKGEPSLLISANQNAVVYIDVPKELQELTVAIWTEELIKYRLYDPEGAEVKPKWQPQGNHAMPYAVADIATDHNTSGVWRVELSNSSKCYRLTEWHGLPIFLKKPCEHFPFSFLKLKCFGKAEELDFRASIIRNGSLEATWDLLSDEIQIIPTICGRVDLIFEAGFEYGKVHKSIELHSNELLELSVSLKRTLEIPAEWKRGDHHSHSYYEDAGSSPEKMARAARVNGLDYFFLTDLGAENIINAGLFKHNKEQKFLALPGQEFMNKRVHMNALNLYENIPYDFSDEAEWMRRIEASETKTGQPALLMLNHPSHVRKAALSQAYFRSWWMATAYPQLTLVENCDFRTWFDFINRGKKLTRLWTTDTHDATYYMPGKKCSYVNTGGKLDALSILEALKNGKVTNSVYPGVFLNLSVNSYGIGETVSVKSDANISVDVLCTANRTIKRIELIGDGEPLFSWDGLQTERFGGSVTIPSTCKWIIALAYLNIEDGCFRQEEIEDDQALMLGCHAFTNPVFIENDTDL